MEREDKGCYYYYDVEQGSEKWKKLREGLITASNISKVVGRAPYYHGTKEELALELTGEVKPVHSPRSIKRMSRGTINEPKARKLLEKQLGLKIEETGLAVWKKDERFGASLDGVIDEDTAIEIKCPAKMYPPILEYMSDENRDPKDFSHIYHSHYDQMIQNGVITGRKWMIFCVYGLDDKLFFTQMIKVDHKHWNRILYRPASLYHEKYMKPILDERQKKKKKSSKN